MKKKLLLAILFLITIVESKAQSWNEITKSLPTPYIENLNNQYYGKSVAIDGNYAVVGANGYTNYQGTAFVLFYNGIDWQIQAQLTTNDGTDSDNFGISVSISGDHIIIGADGDTENGSNSGSAYIYTKPTTGWVTTANQTAKLLPNDGLANQKFGQSVSISGDHVIIGAQGSTDNGSNSGSAYIYTKPASGWATTSTQTAKLLPDDGAASDLFGYAVAISGDNVVIGAYGNNNLNFTGNNAGSAYVYTKPATGWVTTSNQTAKLLPDDAAASDLFGFSVSISGEYIIIGAVGNSDFGYKSGSAYVYKEPISGWATTSTQTAKLLPDDGAYNDQFGRSVSISNNHVIVTAPYSDNYGTNSGSAYIFNKPASGWITTSNQTDKITPNDGGGNHNFGYSVSISGENILIGSQQDSVNGFLSGSAYFYKQCFATSSNITITECSSYTVPSGDETYTTPGTYSVKDTIENICGSDSVITIDLTINLDLTLVNTSYQLTANQTGASYKWLDCNNGYSVIAGETLQTFKPTSNGDYAAEITVGNCTDTSACENIYSVGIDKNNIDNTISIYPNPTTGIFNVNLDYSNLLNKQYTQISIIDITGKEILSKNIINETQIELSLNDFSNGVYFVKIKRNEQQRIIKLIKE